MTQLNAYLFFDGNCREAMTFYKECLGGELVLQAVEETPMAKQMPAEVQKKIIHSTLTKDGAPLLMASDMMEAGGRKNGNAIALTLNCGSAEEIKTRFAKLATGGKITSALKEEFWGGMFGTLTDKFGNEWLLNYEKPRA
jgi:PhnB protein